MGEWLAWYPPAMFRTFDPLSFPHPPIDSDIRVAPPLDKEGKRKALRLTQDTLRDLVKIGHDLDLPATSLPQILEVYAASAREVFLEQARAESEARCQRLPMEMKSIGADLRAVRIPPGKVHQVTSRPQWVA